MCSNCSGDDLRPESFTNFDISSPKTPPVFATGSTEKRSPYRTRRYFPHLLNAALTLAISRRPKNERKGKIIRSVHRGNLVNLFDHEIQPQIGVKNVSLAPVAAPFEVRVSANAIIEVYAAPEFRGTSLDDGADTGTGEFSAWEESCIARRELRMAMEEYRRARSIRICFAYVAFVAVAALAIWSATR